MNVIKKALRSGPIMFLVFLATLIVMGSFPVAVVGFTILLWAAMAWMSIALLVRVFRPNQTAQERERAIYAGQLSVMPRWLRTWILDDESDRWSAWFR